MIAYRRLLLALSLPVAAPNVSAHTRSARDRHGELRRPLEVAIEVTANLEALLAGIGPEHKDTDHAPRHHSTMRSERGAGELKARFQAFAPRWLDGIQIEFDGQRLAPRRGVEVRRSAIPASPASRRSG